MFKQAALPTPKTSRNMLTLEQLSRLSRTIVSRTTSDITTVSNMSMSQSALISSTSDNPFVDLNEHSESHVESFNDSGFQDDSSVFDSSTNFDELYDKDFLGGNGVNVDDDPISYLTSMNSFSLLFVNSGGLRRKLGSESTDTNKTSHDLTGKVDSKQQSETKSKSTDYMDDRRTCTRTLPIQMSKKHADLNKDSHFSSTYRHRSSISSPENKEKKSQGSTDSRNCSTKTHTARRERKVSRRRTNGKESEEFLQSDTSLPRRGGHRAHCKAARTQSEPAIGATDKETNVSCQSSLGSSSEEFNMLNISSSSLTTPRRRQCKSKLRFTTPMKVGTAPFADQANSKIVDDSSS